MPWVIISKVIKISEQNRHNMETNTGPEAHRGHLVVTCVLQYSMVGFSAAQRYALTSNRTNSWDPSGLDLSNFPSSFTCSVLTLINTQFLKRVQIAIIDKKDFGADWAHSLLAQFQRIGHLPPAALRIRSF